MGVQSGLLFVVSAPSGTGKSTVASRLLSRFDDLEFSVSYTTRPLRPGETDGQHYHFVSRSRFEAMIEERAFLEWADVFGQLYGTGSRATHAALAQGRHLLLDIDVQGARQVRGSGVPVVSVMLLPPDYRTLEARLRSRGSEGDQTLSRRLSTARREAEEYRSFDYVVVNRDLERTVAEVESILRAERLRTSRSEERARSIIATFPGERG